MAGNVYGVVAVFVVNFEQISLIVLIFSTSKFRLGYGN